MPDGVVQVDGDAEQDPGIPRREGEIPLQEALEELRVPIQAEGVVQRLPQGAQLRHVLREDAP